MIALDVHLPEYNPLPPDMVSDMFGHLFFASGVCAFICLLAVRDIDVGCACVSACVRSGNDRVRFALARI